MEAIKPEELRIGNYVIGLSNTIEVVESITEYSVDTNIHDNTYYSQLEPILITEEILLNTGFTTDGVSYLLNVDIDLKIVLVPVNGFYPSIDKADDKQWNHVDLDKIDYLHELQNFVYTITKKELKWNQK